MMKPIIHVSFNRLTTTQEEIQRTYDYVISLGWTEHQTGHRTGGPNLIGTYAFMWLSDKAPVFPENIEYTIIS